MNTLSSHVLDTTLGKPAQGIALTLTLPDGSTLSGETDNDGRFKNWGVEDGFPQAFIPCAFTASLTL